MLGFFDWISDEMSPPQNTYDPAVGRPRCKKCGKDAWLMWNGTYSAYCSTECHNGDKRKRPGRSSVNSLLPSRGTRQPATTNAFERALAAKKAARDLKAAAKKWASRKKKELQEETYPVDAQEISAGRIGEQVRETDSPAQREAEEAEFHKMQACLAHMAEELAKEQLRSQEEKFSSSVKLPTPVKHPVNSRVSLPKCSNLLSAEAAALEQAFADEFNRQVEEERRQKTREAAGRDATAMRDLLRSTQASASAVSSRREDKEKEDGKKTSEQSGRDTKGEGTCHRFTSQQGGGKNEAPVDDKQRSDNGGYEADWCGSPVEGRRRNLPVAKYSHSTDACKHSSSEPYVKIRRTGKRHNYRRQYRHDSIGRVPKKRGPTEPGKSPAPTIGNRPPDKDGIALRLNPKRDSLQREHAEPDSLDTARNSLPSVKKDQSDEAAATEFPPFAGKHLKTLSHVLPGHAVSTTTQQNQTGLFRVAGTNNTCITLNDLQQLREAAWKEATISMDRAGAGCDGSEYAGTLEVHVLSAEKLNSTRVSPEDTLYVIVRCQASETEWIEKRSRCVKNRRWDETLTFPVMFEKYPLRARVCVQLWTKTPHVGNGDLFVGEAEIPFPLTVARWTLPVQLCWNTALGGNVVTLDCGRLQLAVHFKCRDTGEANTNVTQTKTVLSGVKEPPQGRPEITPPPLQAETPSNVRRNDTTEQRNRVHNQESLRQDVHKLANYVDNDESPGDRKRTRRTPRGARESADGKADLKWRHLVTLLQYLRVDTLAASENTAVLSPTKGRTREDRNATEQGDTTVSATKKAYKQSGGHGLPHKNEAAGTGKNNKYSSPKKEGHPVYGTGRVSTDSQSMKHDGKRVLQSCDALASAQGVSGGATEHSETETTATEEGVELTLRVASKSAETQPGVVSSCIRRTRPQERVSATVSSSGMRQTTSDDRARYQSTAADKASPPSAICHNRISEAELQVLLPVALAQMDDFAHYGAEPGRLAPAANLDTCVLVEPWCTGSEKWTHCANRSCRRIISNRSLNDLFEEEEFRAWGCCSACQGQMFHTEVAASAPPPPSVIHISVETGMYDEFALTSLIPLAFPNLSVIWPSSRHLYVAQRFTHVQIQNRFRQCSTQQELTSTLMAPLLKYFVRSDWNTYRHVALRTSVRLKIQQHPRLQLLLAGTGRALLYDPTVPDFWDSESRGNAGRTNLVGTLLMELRKDYV